MKPLATFPVGGKFCEIARAPKGFYLRLVGQAAATALVTDDDARWLSKSALESGAKEVRWTGEALAAWEALEG